MDAYKKYFAMRDAGATPQEVFLAARDDNPNLHECFKIIGTVYNLSLVETKEVYITAVTPATSLDEFQEKYILPAIEEIVQILEREEKEDASPD